MMDKNVDTLLQKLYDLIKDNRLPGQPLATDIISCSEQFSDFIWRSEFESKIKPKYERYIQYLKTLKNGNQENINELKDITHEMISAIAQVPDYNETLKELKNKIDLQVENELNNYWEDRKIK